MTDLRTLSFVVLVVAAITPPAAAQDSVERLYCEARGLGVYFYCEQPDDLMTERLPPDEPPVSSMSAAEQAERIKAQVLEARAAAVLRPTPQNVAAYIRLQREQLDRASLFTDVWRRVLWAQPELDYTLERPVGQLAKQVWLQDRKSGREDAVRAIGERYGLFYFYAASCSACEAFSPVLRAFADAHGLSVKAVSTDGGGSVYFPNAVVDRGQMATMGLGDAPTPAVALFDADTKEVIPVAFGLVSAADLADRIFLLTTTEPGDDF